VRKRHFDANEPSLETDVSWVREHRSVEIVTNEQLRAPDRSPRDQIPDEACAISLAEAAHSGLDLWIEAAPDGVVEWANDTLEKVSQVGRPSLRSIAEAEKVLGHGSGLGTQQHPVASPDCADGSGPEGVGEDPEANRRRVAAWVDNFSVFDAEVRLQDANVARVDDPWLRSR
jgi:hypothetical protein